MDSTRTALRDWLFAKATKRLLLAALLSQGDRRWTRTELASACGQHPKARMDLHLGPLTTAGVIDREGDLYRVVADEALAKALRELLQALEAPGP